MEKKLKAGVLGAGHLGKIHLRLLFQSEKYDLVGFYDENQTVRDTVAKENGFKAFDSATELMDAVEVVDIVTPTLFHHKLAKQAIEKGKHIFIEKPITQTVDQAEELITLADKYGVLGQVGHVERFNPAFLAVKNEIDESMFIETHRLAEFNPRGTDVPVVLDLMIHDIDTVLSVVDSRVKNISASGVSIISETPDIANARIEFENGCVANLTASRISLKNMRKARFFQKDAYISIDYFDKKVEVVKMHDAPEQVGDFDMVLENAQGKKKRIFFDNPKVPEVNAILMELECFADAIVDNTPIIVPLTQGRNALDIALQITALVENSTA
ncbi:MAG: scyllo-inositol 2-dehydrogenase (NAD(+)) [Flavobacteriales bacterium]|nr:MAG: gfo/Idh/MocA family oxidoreductase [Flavobacteriales bacterium]RPF73437.1 MAG: gfo/Idh/MocA family oxidoreductase [Thiotrichales bacterium TMED285]CAI8268821.1 MAG: scyllo-inositol 2-dehydrogenase (NAD(+)) [Flavobacteriales bacterium]|tara:strand:- start:2248 stop:3231 length:984 start_codon:yes stop_codon:yes gene_type:complete